MRRQSRTILLFLSSIFFVYFVSRGDLASHSHSVSVRDYTLIVESEDYFLRLAEDFDTNERTKRSDALHYVSPLGSNLDPRYIYNRNNAYRANEGARHIPQQYSRDQYFANRPENDETELELDIKSPSRPTDVQSFIQPPSPSSVSSNSFQPGHNLFASISTSPPSLISVEHISTISPTPSIKDIALASHTSTTSYHSSLNVPSFSIPQPYNIDHSKSPKLPSISSSLPARPTSSESYIEEPHIHPIQSPSYSASPSSSSISLSSSSSSPSSTSSLSSPSSRHMTFIPPIPTYYQEFGSHPLPPQGWYIRDADKGRWVAYFHDQAVATLHYTPDGLVDNCTILEVIETWEQRKALRYLGAVMPLRPVSLPDMVHLMALCGDLTTPSTPPPPSSPAPRGKSDWWLGSSALVGILPGTMWCGRRDQAGSYHHLGARTRLDSCCRTHDHCPVKLLPFVYRYTISNIALSTKLHCLCEVEFYRCLKNLQDPLADSIGELYFNILGNDCIDASPPSQRRPPKSSSHSSPSSSSPSSHSPLSGYSPKQPPSSKDAFLSRSLPNQSYLSESLPTYVPVSDSPSKYAAQSQPSQGNPSISQPSSVYPSPPQSSSNHPSLLQPSSTSPSLPYPPPPHTLPSSTNSGERETKEMGEVRRRMECSSKDAEGECRLWLLNPKATVKYILRPTNLKY